MLLHTATRNKTLISRGTSKNVAAWIGDVRLITVIADHSARVLKGNHRCSLSHCPHCGQAPMPTIFFRRHALRQRHFLVIEGRYVHSVEGFLARWRCPFCRRTFTEYPAFALPYKRYIVFQMAPRSLRYVQDDQISYRKGVLQSYLPIFHRIKPFRDAASYCTDESVLAHSTLYHWISTLGDSSRLTSTNRCGQQGREFMPAEWKYVTVERRGVLLICREHCLSLIALI